MAYTAEQRTATTAAVKPNLWARLAVRHTKKTCGLSCLVPLLALVLVLATGRLSVDTPTSADYAIRNDVRTRLDDARAAALEEYPWRVEGAVDERETYDVDASLAMLFRGKVDGAVAALGETSDRAPNVLTREGAAMMKAAEDEMMEDEEFRSFCLRGGKGCDGEELHCELPYSVLMSEHLYGVYKDGVRCGRAEGADVVSEDRWERFLEELKVGDGEGEDVGKVNPLYSPYLGSDYDEANGTWIAQIFFDVGKPFEGYTAADDRMEEQTKEYNEWALRAATRAEQHTTDDVDVFLVGTQLIDANFDGLVLRDLSFSIAAMVLVFLVIWLHTTSAYLALTSMAQIFLAFPFAFAFYHFVLRQLYFAALQILVIFLLLGIGADDVFVFTDAWKQAAVVLDVNDSEDGLITRLSWTYRRAVRAMSVTSFTTAAAFFVTAVSPIMPISTLGVWAGILILLQFVLVITMYPCAVITWHRFWRLRPISRCFRKVPAPDEGSMEDPPRRPPFWVKLLPAAWRPAPAAAGAQEYRALEKFFRGPWFRLLTRGKYVIVALAVVLVCVFVYLATRLEPPSESEQFLPDDNELVVAALDVKDAFPKSDADFQVQVRVTWGVKGVDRSGTSRFDPDNPGKPVLDDKFDMKSAAAQQHIHDACDFFERQEELVFQEPTLDAVSCWIRDFKKFRESQGRNGFETYETDAALADALQEFGGHEVDGTKPYEGYLLDQQIAFTAKRDRVVFTEVSFVSPLEPNVPYDTMWPVYREWQKQLRKLNAQAPAELKDEIGNAIATGGYAWIWQITQRALVRSMFVGIAVVLAVALVALTVSTLNWAIAILATLAISGIVAMLLGLIQAYGWKLGITESIGVVIAVGYSFDGAAHIATAYVESSHADRHNRTRDALTDLGISILFGVLSTLLAGVMLLPATIIFFVKFAGLIITTILLGLVWSLMFFPAMLLIVGPTGDFGSLKPMLGKVFKRFGRAPRGDEAYPRKTASLHESHEVDEATATPNTSNGELEGGSAA